MPERPNILLCVCDQLRAFEVGCYGNPVIQTPNMDRLAAEGVRFETAITSFPVCMAARSSLLSGQYNRSATGGIANVAYPSKPGDFNMPEYPEFGRPHLKAPTLAEELRGLGYHTAAIGKWHIHSWPHEIGFDHYLIPRVHHCHSGQSFTENGGEEFVPEGYSVDFEAARVAAYLRERATQDSPFFLYYNISPPHCPVADAPEKYRTMYRSEDIPLRPNVDLSTPLQNQDFWFKVYRYDFRYYNLHLPYTERLPPGYDLRALIAEYYGLTTWTDDALGVMLRALDASGLTDNTLVLFTSDHGDNLGSHGLVQKGVPMEESIRVPMLLRGPGVSGAGRVIPRQIASLVDLMPTCLEMAGGEAPAHAHGQSLAPLLRGEQDTLDTPHTFLETSSGAGIRTDDHLYFLPFSETPRTLAATPSHFYDLAADPYQFENRASDCANDATAKALDVALREWDRITPWMDDT